MSKINILQEEKERILSLYNIHLHEQPDSVMDRRVNIDNSYPEEKLLEKKYPCVNKNFVVPLKILLDKGYDKNILKLALGIIGRESSFGESLRYSVVQPAKEISNFFGINTSSGPAQIKGDKAKELGIKNISSRLGGLDGAYQILKKNINRALSQGYSKQPSNLGNKGTGNGIYDIAIAAYNTGEKYITNWCESTDPEKNKKNLKTMCWQKDANKNKPVKNYVPNLNSERADFVSTWTHGYVKEVAGYYKNFNCF